MSWHFITFYDLRPLHYGWRSIEGGQFRLVNFATHFIRVQIFQIDFPPILSAFNYFKYNSLSFYNCRGQNEHFSINSVRNKGRVELCQIFHSSNWCTKHQFQLSNTNFTMKSASFKIAIFSIYILSLYIWDIWVYIFPPSA